MSGILVPAGEAIVTVRRSSDLRTVTMWVDAPPFHGSLGALLDVWGLLRWLKECYKPPSCRAG